MRSDAASNIIVLLTCESWCPEAHSDDAFGESDQKVPPLFFFGLKFLRELREYDSGYIQEVFCFYPTAVLLG